MLGLDAKAAKAAWTVFLVALAIFTIYEARGPIVVFVLALFFAYLIAPAVDFSMRHVARGRSKAVALAVVYILMVGMLIAIGAALAGKIAEEASSLATQLPQYMTQQDPLAALPFPSWLEPLREKIILAARDQLKNLDEAALPLIRGALGQVLSQAGNALTAILIPILAFFFLKDGHELRGMIVSLAHNREQTDFLNRVLDGLDQCSYVLGE